MIPAEILAVFFLASVALALAPGPDNIFVLTQSALNGHTAGLLVTLGLCSGLLAHTAVVALGIAVIFQTSELAFIVLKNIGATYLLYLAWQAFRATTLDTASGHMDKLSFRRLYQRGVIMNITNPKVSIFFLAFLPQFANPAEGALTLQIISLGFVFMFATLLVFGSVALLAGLLGPWLKRSAKIQRYLNWSAGAVFTALAIRLAMTDF